MPGPYLPVDPAKLIDVERDGVWYPGFFDGWRHCHDGWMAHVRYHVDVGRQHVAWVVADRVRPT